MVQMAGIEPARFIQPQDFKSCASASSATPAWCIINYCHHNDSSDPDGVRTHDLRRDRAAL